MNNHAKRERGEDIEIDVEFYLCRFISPFQWLKRVHYRLLVWSHETKNVYAAGTSANCAMLIRPKMDVSLVTKRSERRRMRSAARWNVIRKTLNFYMCYQPAAKSRYLSCWFSRASSYKKLIDTQKWILSFEIDSSEEISHFKFRAIERVKFWPVECCVCFSISNKMQIFIYKKTSRKKRDYLVCTQRGNISKLHC